MKTPLINPPDKKPVSAVNSDDQLAVSRSWYLLYTKPRQEDIAVRNLYRQHYEIFLPKIRQVRRRRGRRVPCIAPMFPRYLFIALDTVHDNWAPIRSTIGVSNLVKFGNKPAQLPDDLVNILMAHGDERGVHKVDMEEFKPGARIRLCDGPLMGYEGIFVAKTSTDRVTILLDIIGKQSRLFVNPDSLETLI